MGWFSKKPRKPEGKYVAPMDEAAERLARIHDRSAEHAKTMAEIDKKIDVLQARISGAWLECEECNLSSPNVSQLANGMIVCASCTAARRPRTSDELLTAMLSDLDYLDKGPPTEEDLEYVRRSLTEGP